MDEQKLVKPLELVLCVASVNLRRKLRELWVPPQKKTDDLAAVRMVTARTRKHGGQEVAQNPETRAI